MGYKQERGGEHDERIARMVVVSQYRVQKKTASRGGIKGGIQYFSEEEREGVLVSDGMVQAW